MHQLQELAGNWVEPPRESFCIETDIEWKKKTTTYVISLTADLQMVQDHVLKNIQQLSAQTKKKPEHDTWVKLAKYRYVMCRLIMFHKRRQAEVHELNVHDYLAH